MSLNNFIIGTLSSNGCFPSWGFYKYIEGENNSYNVNNLHEMIVCLMEIVDENKRNDPSRKFKDFTQFSIAKYKLPGMEEPVNLLKTDQYGQLDKSTELILIESVDDFKAFLIAHDYTIN